MLGETVKALAQEHVSAITDSTVVVFIMTATRYVLQCAKSFDTPTVSWSRDSTDLRNMTFTIYFALGFHSYTRLLPGQIPLVIE